MSAGRWYRGCWIDRNPYNGMWHTFGTGITTRSLAADTLAGLKALIRAALTGV